MNPVITSNLQDKTLERLNREGFTKGIPASLCPLHSAGSMKE
jgi:hypothetical protein